ncbi:MerR family transcriptional regulator [Roseobacter ponti]|uniref:MerR family transcriptional regulator n=1 Tax=Roseobacter ponti TaxID=1891787 RepID=UPI001FE3B869|nr:MerR family transcriptional regulator [Roseobacter ponti]
MSKSPDAFRTISEVADWLGVQAHVLRFWESKFTQVKPIKRAGGRRYYRPSDMLLLGGLRQLLHEDGLTIKGAQKMLREKGVAHVADMSRPLDDLTMAALDEDTAAAPAFAPAPPAGNEAPAQDAAPGPEGAGDQAADPGPELFESVAPDPAENAPEEIAGNPQDAEPEKTGEHATGEVSFSHARHEPEQDDSAPDALDSDADFSSEGEGAPGEQEDPAPAESASGEIASADATAGETADLPDFLTKPLQDAGDDDSTARGDDDLPAETTPDEAEPVEPEETAAGAEDTTGDSSDENTGPFSVSPPEAAIEPVRPATVDVPSVPHEDEIEVAPSALTALARITRIDSDTADRIRPLLKQLAALRADLSGPGKDAGKD